MLKAIYIKNIAVIRELNIELTEGFTVITGETGAGKSIVIDSIGFVLGAKADREMIRTGEAQAEVSALFSVDDKKALELKELGIPYDENGEITFTRTMTADGKASAKINGKSVSVSLLKNAGARLLTVHGQFDSHILSEKNELIALLDGYIGFDAEKTEYAEFYKSLCDLRAEREKLAESLKDRAMMIDILKYQHKEIENAKLSSPDEEDKLLRLRTKLRSLEKVSKNVNTVTKALLDNEKGITAVYFVERAAQSIKNLTDVMPEAEKLSARLEDIKYELIDIGETVSAVLDEDIDNPEEKLDIVEKRLTQIKKLKNKYGDSLEEIIAKKDEIAEKLRMLEHGDESLEDYDNLIADAVKKAEAKAVVLSEKRKIVAKSLSGMICDVLKDLDMPKVSFLIAVKKRLDSKGIPVFDSNGYDDIEFLVSPNIGEEMQPISKIASGGELSRIMLAIKSTMMSKSGEDTCIFDEIDAGVSGGTSERIGLKLCEMSKGLQVLCITHSAQIAAQGDTHIKIYKKEEDGRVESFVTVLDHDGRVNELSRIIGGINITEKQKRAALEMLEKINKYT